MRLWAGLALALVAGAALGAPERSPHPKPRPGVGPVVSPAPQARPGAPRPVQVVALPPGVTVSPRPPPRPATLRRKAVAQPMVPVRPAPTRLRTGALCGVKALQGVPLSPIPGRIKGCGVAKPVRISSVQGIALSQPAVLDCVTATALNAWVKTSVRPGFGRLGGGVARLEVAASYACRPRNNVRGAKLSEHGKGHAIDISGFTLRNGQTVTVLKGWKDRRQGKLLRALRKAACGPFGTVLGPGSDRYHSNHFHLDTARYRAGHYCR